MDGHRIVFVNGVFCFFYLRLKQSIPVYTEGREKEGEGKRKGEKERERGADQEKHSALLCLAEKKFWFRFWIRLTEAGQSSCHIAMEMEYVRLERLVRKKSRIFPSFCSHLLPLVIRDACGGIPPLWDMWVCASVNRKLGERRRRVERMKFSMVSL